MSVIISSILLVIFCAAFVYRERQRTQRARAFFAESDVALAHLARRTQERYRARVGKEPPPALLAAAHHVGDDGKNLSSSRK